MFKKMHFFTDIKVWLSAWLMSWSLAGVDLMVKIAFGLPGAIYLCLKIYHEFIKPLKKKT